jgi:DNA-binding LytR/AlgR family response regulator
MKILIVEDDPFVAEDLKDKLEKLQYRISAIAESYDAALGHLAECRPDLALVDIELKGDKTGIDLAEKLSEISIPFIYLSSIQDMNTYIKAKSTKPLKNLAKPIDLVNLRNALLDITLPATDAEAAIDERNEDLLHFFTDRHGVRQRIEPADIVYIEADRSYCTIFFADESKSKLSTAMGNVVKKLNHPDLMQISRSHHINRRHVRRLRGNEVGLTVGPYLRISESYRENFSDLVNLL